MIVKPQPQPDGTVFFITRRPDVFIEFCAPCEEVVAGPFESFDEASSLTPVARGQLDRMGLIGQVGILAMRPGIQARLMPGIRARFPRQSGGDGSVVHDESPTRFSADEIRAMAVERHEPLDQPSAPGFEPMVGGRLR